MYWLNSAYSLYDLELIVDISRIIVTLSAMRANTCSRHF